MPCFDPVLTIAAGRALADHRGSENLHAVDDAPEVDVDDAPPFGPIAEQTAPAADSGVVHQERDIAERLVDGSLEALDVIEIADVDGEGSHVVRPRGGRAELRGGGLERFAVGVRHAHLHAERANLAAAARPMPLAAPVTTATLFGTSAG